MKTYIEPQSYQIPEALESLRYSTDRFDEPFWARVQSLNSRKLKVSFLLFCCLLDISFLMCSYRRFSIKPPGGADLFQALPRGGLLERGCLWKRWA